MKNKSLEQLKKEYTEIPIPSELDFVVKKAFKENGVNINKKFNKLKSASILAASVAAAVVLFTVGVNTSPVFAETLSKVPVVGSIVKVLTCR